MGKKKQLPTAADHLNSATLEDDMKAFRLSLLVVSLLVAALSFADDAKPEAKPNPAFEKIKSLSGDWQATVKEGDKTITAINRFQVISGGSAVLISEEVPNESSMATIVHTDGPTLMATHYCGAGNQPRFVAEPSTDPNVIAFKFKDVTNLAGPDAARMEGVVFKFVDADHHIQEWTFRDKGKDTKYAFEFSRKK
jgi:hypothetical protein